MQGNSPKRSAVRTRSVLGRYVWRSLMRNRTRSLVALVGIVMACALLTSIATSVTSLDRWLDGFVELNEGSWQAYGAGEDDLGSLHDLATNPAVTQAISSSELGCAWMEHTDEGSQPLLLTVRTLPYELVAARDEDANPLCEMPAITSGCMPKAEGEIALPSSLEGASVVVSDGDSWSAQFEDLGLGDVVELPLGWRHDESTGLRMSADEPSTWEYADWDNLAQPHERIVGARVRSYEVVGFYDTQYAARDSFTGADEGLAALAVACPPTGLDHIWVSTAFSRLSDIRALMDPIFGEQAFWLHWNLLAAQGIGSPASGEAWSALWWLVAILGSLVAVTSASLVRNALGISVAERTSELALLASLGASRRQVRRTVLIEAAALAVVGVPLGLVLGLAGSAVAFEHLGSDISYILMDRKLSSVVAVADPLILAVVAAVMCAVVLASALVPAREAGSLTPAEGLRARHGGAPVRGGLSRLASLHLPWRRVTRRGEARAQGKATRAERRSRASRKRGPLAHALGVPGLLAERNLRARRPGRRSVSASLALSVALVVLAGSVSTAIDPLLGLSGYDASIDLVAVLSAWEDSSLDATQRSAVLQGLVADFGTQASGASSVTELRRYLLGHGCPELDPAMLSSDLDAVMYELGVSTDVDSPEIARAQFLGRYSGYDTIVYVEDELWEEMLAQARVTSEPREGMLQALIMGSFVYDKDNERVRTHCVDSTGTVRVFLPQQLDGYAQGGRWVGRDGHLWLEYMATQQLYSTNYGQEVRYVVTEGAEYLSGRAEDLCESWADVQVVGVIDDLMGIGLGNYERQMPVLVLPTSSLGSHKALVAEVGFIYYGLADGTDEEKAEDELVSYDTSPEGTLYVNNIARDQHQARSLFGVIEVLVVLYAVLTTIVAMAGAAITLAGSIVLRAEELSVLGAVGMDRRGRRTMVVAECAVQALRGIAWGLAAALGVSALFWRMAGLAWQARASVIPWGGIAAGVAVAVAVTALSAGVALRRVERQTGMERLRRHEA